MNSVLDFSYETNTDITSSGYSPVPHTRIGNDHEGLGHHEWSLLQEIHQCSVHWKRLAHPTGFEPVTSAFGGNMF